MYQSYDIFCRKKFSCVKVDIPKIFRYYQNSFKRIIQFRTTGIRKAYFLELSELKMLTTNSPIWKFLILDHNCNKSLHDDILTKDNKIKS